MGVWDRLRPRKPTQEPVREREAASTAVERAAPLTTVPAPPQPAPAPPQPEWRGARWQVDIRPPGAAAQPATSFDATTTPEAHAWAVTVLERLASARVEARIGQDQGEDGRGNPTTYDQLLITVGEGYMALAFWRDVVAWTVEVFADQVDRDTFAHVATRVLAVVQDVTGYALDPGRLGPDERSLVGAGEPDGGGPATVDADHGHP